MELYIHPLHLCLHGMVTLELLG